MQQEKESYWGSLTLKFLALLVLFSATRLLFFFCNYNFFAEEPLKDILLAFIVGIRFDAAAIAAFNFPIWIFWSLPFRCRGQRFAKVLFFLVNLLALVINVIDAKYFSFTLRRMGGEIFSQSVLLKEDISIYVDMLCRYWYVTVVGVISAYVLMRIAARKNPLRFISKIDYIYFIISTACLLICYRGGIQRKPIKPVDARIFVKTERTASLANNSAFKVFHTIKNDNLRRLMYFPKCSEKLKKLNPRHLNAKESEADTSSFKRKNIFIIILESFSAEYIGALDSKFKTTGSNTYAPFLDSLMEKSLIFDGFANGTVSNDALTSIILGVPTLSDFSYATSAYSDNPMCSSISLLKKEGFKTLFFYGGKPNSCHFDGIRSKAGIEEYYCQYDYDGPSSNVSGWGVYDEEFFQFAAKKIDQVQQPFLSILFTLSSHHPYLYPAKLHGQFPTGTVGDPLEELISYTDYSLRKFFETAEKMDWYRNTIFVLVADHIAKPQQRYYKNSLGRYSIPIVFFDPNAALIGKSDVVAQQIDIMPSVLDLIGVRGSYFSFGNSLFDQSAPKFSISYKDGLYQLITKNFVCKFDGKKVVEFYDRSDFLLEKNLINDGRFFDAKEEHEELIKIFLQNYTESIIDNDMCVGE